MDLFLSGPKGQKILASGLIVQSYSGGANTQSWDAVAIPVKAVMYAQFSWGFDTPGSTAAAGLFGDKTSNGSLLWAASGNTTPTYSASDRSTIAQLTGSLDGTSGLSAIRKNLISSPMLLVGGGVTPQMRVRDNSGSGTLVLAYYILGNAGT